MCELDDFGSRCDFFLEFYREKLASFDKIFSGTEEIVRAVLSDISDKKGIVRIDQIAEDSGYTSRYIEEVFSEAMGISPKSFRARLILSIKILQQISALLQPILAIMTSRHLSAPLKNTRV